MRKLSVVLALGMCLVGVAGQAWAADEDTITVTVSLESVISVVVAPDTWVIGAIAIDGSDGPESFTATVGNIATKLEIKGADGAGGWVIGTPGAANQFEVACSNPVLTLTLVDQVLSASVAAYGNHAFDLTYTAPTSDTLGGGVDQSFSITLKASAP